jgi:ABC-2 type transport system permease protein
VVVSAFLILCGAYTFVLNPFFVIGNATLVPFFEFAPFLFTLFIPAITMRSVAEERSTGMLEVLQTWPVDDAQWIIGKYLGAFSLILWAIILTIPFPIAVSLIGSLDWGGVIGGYLGLCVLGATYCSLGIVATTFTKNQIVAFILGFLLCFFFFVIGRISPYLGSELASISEFLSFERRISAMARGVLELRDVVFFVSLISLCLGLASEGLHARRWR